jgi:hypothetical protein
VSAARFGREIRDSLVAILTRECVQVTVDISGGNRYRYRFEVNGVKLLHFTAFTPSDYKAKIAMEKDLMRKIREARACAR